MSFADTVRLMDFEDQKSFVLNHLTVTDGQESLARYFGWVSKSPLEWDRLITKLADIWVDKNFT